MLTDFPFEIKRDFCDTNAMNNEKARLQKGGAGLFYSKVIN